MSARGDVTGGHRPAPAARTWTRGRLARLTALCWVVTFGFSAIWSLATPLWSTPDAPSHDLMAYHVVRDDLSIEPTDVFAHGVSSNAITMAPKGLLDSATSVGCYAFQPTPADCLVPTTNDSTMMEFANSAGRNLPTYYLATGWPSLFSSTQHAVWANRAAAVAISSFFLAWAASAALTRTRRSVALSGVAIAVTPMVLYLSGAVNPNSLEITAGIALAACGIAFVQERANTWLAHVMLRRAMLAATVMVTIRMLAPIWVLAWLAAFCLVMTREHWRHALSRRGVVWVALPVIGALFNVFWTYTSGVSQLHTEPQFANSLWTNLTQSKNIIDTGTIAQQIGIFGWLDTPLHPGMYTMYTWASLFMVFMAVSRLNRREVAAVAFLAAAQYVLPIVLQALQYNANGPVWQGRYTLPLTVSVPIFALMLAAAKWDNSRSLQTVTWAFPVALAALALVHFRAMIIEMRRNVSGLGGPSFLEGVWQPPLGALTLVAALGLLLAAVLGFFGYLFAAEGPGATRSAQTPTDRTYRGTYREAHREVDRERVGDVGLGSVTPATRVGQPGVVPGSP